MASSLLGGTMARSIADEAIRHIFNKAISSVRAGELRRMAG